MMLGLVELGRISDNFLRVQAIWSHLGHILYENVFGGIYYVVLKNCVHYIR